MSFYETVHAEINEILDSLQARRQPFTQDWITHEVCNRHSDGLAVNDDADFWRRGAFKTVRNEVRRCINKRAGDTAEADKKQSVLPGFDHLHSYYVIERGGEEIGLSIHDLTDSEIEQKATLYRSMGAACFAHADELDRYKDLRTDDLFSEAVSP